jgi:hypothetical protein
MGLVEAARARLGWTLAGAAAALVVGGGTTAAVVGTQQVTESTAVVETSSQPDPTAEPTVAAVEPTAEPAPETTTATTETQTATVDTMPTTSPTPAPAPVPAPTPAPTPAPALPEGHRPVDLAPGQDPEGVGSIGPDGRYWSQATGPDGEPTYVPDSGDTVEPLPGEPGYDGPMEVGVPAEG